MDPHVEEVDYSLQETTPSQNFWASFEANVPAEPKNAANVHNSRFLFPFGGMPYSIFFFEKFKWIKIMIAGVFSNWWNQSSGIVYVTKIDFGQQIKCSECLELTIIYLLILFIITNNQNWDIFLIMPDWEVSWWPELTLFWALKP